MHEIIRTQALKKHFGKVRAVDGIDICVGKGEIYGFLGMNGAGKTTTIRMLLGMIRPTSGEAYLHGKRVKAYNTSIWNRVGYLVEIPYAYPDLTVKENLEIIRRLRFIHESTAVEEVIKNLRLDPYRDVKAANLSLGNAQRLGLAKALIHHPDILILDEPANGLDPVGIAEIREMLQDLATKGVTVFVSSHMLGEITKFTTRIGIIHKGKLIQESGTDQMMELRHRYLKISTLDNRGAGSILQNAGYQIIKKENDFFILTGKDALDRPGHVNTTLVQAGFPPHLLKVEEEDLETYFLRVIGENGGIP